MPPAAPADLPSGGDVHDLISAIQPDQERLAKLSKQLQQMENGAGLIDKLKAFRHGGVQNAMEKLRDEIAGVQQEMFAKLPQSSSMSRSAAGGDPSDSADLKNQIATYQDQLAVDDHFKQAGMPGLLDQGQRRDVEKLLLEETKKLDILDGQQQAQGRGQDGPSVEKKVSVRDSLNQGAGSTVRQGQSADAPRIGRSSHRP